MHFEHYTKTHYVTPLLLGLKATYDCVLVMEQELHQYLVWIRSRRIRQDGRYEDQGKGKNSMTKRTCAFCAFRMSPTRQIQPSLHAASRNTYMCLTKDKPYSNCTLTMDIVLQELSVAVEQDEWWGHICWFLPPGDVENLSLLRGQCHLPVSFRGQNSFQDEIDLIYRACRSLLSLTKVKLHSCPYVCNSSGTSRRMLLK